MAAEPGIESSADPLRRLDSAVLESQKQVNWLRWKAARWKWAYYGMGGLSTLLTALAGVAILAEWFGKNVAGAIAVGSALLTSLVGFFNFDGRVVRVRLERARWRGLYQQALSLRSVANSLGKDDLIERVDALWKAFQAQEEEDAAARERQ